VFQNKESTNRVDVYSYTILTFEIVSGISAFNRLRTYNAVQRVVMPGRRPVIPRNVPAARKRLIQLAWLQDPATGPPFIEICNMLLTGMLNLDREDLDRFQFCAHELEG